MTAILIAIGVLALIMLVSTIDCALHINVTEYKIPMEGIKSSLSFVCISDLHSWHYGRDNRKLLKLIAEQKPSFIVIAGDMITRRATEKQLGSIVELIKRLDSIAPVYYATGNHEFDYFSKNGAELLDRIADTGAAVLYDSFADVTAGDNNLRIGAASGRYFDGSENDGNTLKMLESIGKDDLPSVAIIHQPENIFNQEKRSEWTADLYISGHTHGGVWRIPCVGGVMSPAEGLFPKYDKGEYLIDGKMPLIINSGLSGYYFIPRVFNRPEISRIELSKKSTDSL